MHWRIVVPVGLALVIAACRIVASETHEIDVRISSDHAVAALGSGFVAVVDAGTERLHLVDSWTGSTFDQPVDIGCFPVAMASHPEEMTTLVLCGGSGIGVIPSEEHPPPDLMRVPASESYGEYEPVSAPSIPIPFTDITFCDLDTSLDGDTFLTASLFIPEDGTVTGALFRLSAEGDWTWTTSYRDAYGLRALHGDGCRGGSSVSYDEARRTVSVFNEAGGSSNGIVVFDRDLDPDTSEHFWIPDYYSVDDIAAFGDHTSFSFKVGRGLYVGTIDHDTGHWTQITKTGESLFVPSSLDFSLDGTTLELFQLWLAGGEDSLTRHTME